MGKVKINEGVFYGICVILLYGIVTFQMKSKFEFKNENMSWDFWEIQIRLKEIN